MSEFFAHPNPPTEQERQDKLRRDQERAQRERVAPQANEIRRAVRALTDELGSRRIKPAVTLFETAKQYPAGFLTQLVTGQYWRSAEPSVLGKGWVVSTKDYHSVGAQDGYAASMNGSDSNDRRTIVLTDDAKLMVGHYLNGSSLQVWGEVNLHDLNLYGSSGRPSFGLSRRENAPIPLYSGDLFKDVALEDIERDLRTSGRQLLGYS